jgi:hypothetical protein
MGNRACPLCFAKVPRLLVLSRSEGLLCPACQTQLEISRPSRLLGAAAGLLAAFAATHFARSFSPSGDWVLSLASAVFGFAVGSALILFFVCDLVVRPKPSPASFPHSHE